MNHTSFHTSLKKRRFWVLWEDEHTQKNQHFTKKEMMQQIFLLASIALLSTSVLAAVNSTCIGRPIGRFCQGDNGIVECDTQGLMSGTSCITAHIEGKSISGKCIETNDGKAYCRSPTPSICDSRSPGKFCSDLHVIATCRDDGGMSIENCFYDHNGKYDRYGECRHDNDGNPYCRHYIRRRG